MKIIITLLMFLFISSVYPADKDRGRVMEEEPVGKEKIVMVSIKYGNGFIDIGKSNRENVYEGEFIYKGYRPDIKYKVIGEEGYLDIYFSGDVSKGDDEEKSRRINSFDELYDNEMMLKFNPEIPMNLDFDFGVIKGDLDLSGLSLKNIDLEVGVSKTEIFFLEPNPVVMESFSIEGGVGKLNIEKIGNARLREFNFEGGIGSYELDFSGEYKENMEAKIELGMGKLVLYLPTEIGTRITVDKTFLSSFSIDDVYKNGDVYTNDRWEKTRYNLDLNIETGPGKIDVIWVK
ncbi:MAG: hypothetical protein EH225_02870 [Calditrichaeota bacterium]|nr:hypothetical protein [Calditrichota bacterium]RQV93586.1 MAG: hypothetical protein EH221_09290 [bacterium]RQW06690.1 MAG: hypothetical protein EH225_02870 [Calditrichota bacterium]